MKLTIDFDNNTVSTEQGTLFIDDLSTKREKILEILGLEEINVNDLKNDINNLFKDLGLNNVSCIE